MKTERRIRQCNCGFWLIVAFDIDDKGSDRRPYSEDYSGEVYHRVHFLVDGNKTVSIVRNVPSSQHANSLEHVWVNSSVYCNNCGGRRELHLFKP